MNNNNILKKCTALFLALISVVLFTVPSFAADGDTDSSVEFYIQGEVNDTYANEVLLKLNELRSSVGESSLKMNSVLCDIAAQRAAEIAVYFSHTRPDGNSCFTFSVPGWQHLGENIAIGYTSPEAVMEGWTNSQGHYDNMVYEEYTDVGIACFKSTNGYLCWVQYFSKCDSSPVTKSGKSVKTFKISATSQYVNLTPSNGSYSFTGKNAGASFTLDVYNVNTGFSYVRQCILPDTVSFSSTDDTVAESLGSGTFRVRGYGETEIKASLGSLGTVSASVSVQKSGTSDSDLMFVLNDKGDGYILSDCDESVSGALTVPSYYNGLPVTGVGDKAFYGCNKLTSVTLPESIVSIGRFAFLDCTSLSSLRVPDSVTYIGMNAFGYYEKNEVLTKNANAEIICKSGSVAARYATENGLKKIIYGDVNGDGEFTETDYRDIINIALSDSNTKAAATKYDLNSDGVLDEKDCALAKNNGMNTTDYNKLLNKVSTNEPVYNARADFDGDGVVDVIDCALAERMLSGH